MAIWPFNRSKGLGDNVVTDGPTTTIPAPIVATDAREYTPKYRLLSWLTLIPSIFSFIAIILINVGGVDSGASYSWCALTPEKNTAYNMVNWEYITTPSDSTDGTLYAYHLYLNRLCGLTYMDDGSSISSCRNNRINGWIYSGFGMWAPNTWIFSLGPFRFSNIDLNAPFAFYMLAAIWCVFVMMPGMMGARHFGSRMAGLVNSGICFMFLLIASGCITGQMETLKRQILANTLTDITGVSVLVTSVSSGSVLLGLTWAATIAMLVEMVMWGVALGHASDVDERQRDAEMEKGERKRSYGSEATTANANAGVMRETQHVAEEERVDGLGA